MTDERLAELMVKVADGLADAAEQTELDAHLADHPALREELAMHEKLNAITDGWVHRLRHDLRDDAARHRVGPRLWVGLGATLLLLGLGILTGGGVVELLLDPEAPDWVKVGTGAVAAGSVMLLAAVGWRRLTRRDPYQEVIR